MDTGSRQEGRHSASTISVLARCPKRVFGDGGDDETRHQLQAWCGMPRKAKRCKSRSQRCLMLRPALLAGLAEDRSRRQQDVLSQRELQCCAPARGGTWTKESAPSLSLQQIFSLLPNKLQHFFVI